jgi:ABC-type nickel/cobalt efflux system permease component RcnA
VAGLLTIVTLGFVLGMRHACNPDDVVAISTIVTRHRSVSGAALVGAIWGIGHTITIMVVGVAIIAFSFVVPPRLGLSMELAVGLILILLGVTNLSGPTHRVFHRFGAARVIGTDRGDGLIHSQRASARRATPFASAPSSFWRLSPPSAWHIPSRPGARRRNRAWSGGVRGSSAARDEHDSQPFLVRDLSGRIRPWNYRWNDADQHRDGGSGCDFACPY